MADHSDDKNIDPGVHRVFADLSRVAVLQILRGAERPLTVREIADEMGLHTNTVRSHLAILTEHGYVEGATEDRDRPGRPRLLYTAVDVDSASVRNYRLLAETLITYLAARSEDRAASAIEAGRGYGERAMRGRPPLPEGDGTAAIGAIVELMDQSGFKPRASTGGERIDLHRCPFRELAEADPDIVCGVHLGIMRGALAELGSPVRAERLHPFAGPDLCVADLSLPGGPDRDGEVES